MRTGSAPIRVDVADDLASTADEWGELAWKLGAPPFLHPGWLDAWWAAFGRGSLRIVTARRAGELIGVLPLELRHGRWRAPTNPHTPAFDLLALDADVVRALADWLMSRQVRDLALAPLAADGQGIRELERAARAHGYRAVTRPAGRAAYLRLPSDLRAHERALSRNLRHDAERRLRRLCEAGSVSVQIADGGEQLETLLDEGFRVEQLSWKGRGGTAVAARRSTRLFYGRLAGWAAETGALRLAFLRLNGRAIAFQFDLEVPPAYYSLKIGYDDSFARYSPGKLLAYMAVARAVTHGLTVYELLGTDEPWKYRWTELGHDRVSFRAFAPTPAGRLWSFAVLDARPVIRRLPLATRLAAALRRR